MARDKHRIRFEKAGTLRLVSHHDLKRCFERMLRRAELPFASTEGFHPQPRLVFGLSLALGVVGRDEVVDLLLTDAVAPEEVRDRLARQAPPGLAILRVERIDPRARILARLATYALPLPQPVPELTERAAALLARPELWYERTRPEPRRINVRPYLAAVRVEANAVAIDLIVTPTGTARPEEIFALLGLSDVLEAGAVMERTRLELQDEAPEESPHDEIRKPLAPASGERGWGEGADLPEPPHPRPLSAEAGARGASDETIQDTTFPPPAPSGVAADE